MTIEKHEGAARWGRRAARWGRRWVEWLGQQDLE